MKYVIGVSDLKLSKCEGDTLVTYALGSCVGIILYDHTVHVGGILHYMLPLAKVDELKAKKNPAMFGDTGIPLLFNEAYKLGAKKENIQVKMAGGAEIFENNDFFAIGKRNVIIARKMFWKNNVLITAEHTGGSIPRNLFLEIGDGKSWITSRGERMEL